MLPWSPRPSVVIPESSVVQKQNENPEYIYVDSALWSDTPLSLKRF